MVRDKKMQTCQVISLQSDLFLCPELSGSYTSLHLFCYISLVFISLVTNLIFHRKSLRQHMRTVCLQPRIHTFPPQLNSSILHTHTENIQASPSQSHLASLPPDFAFLPHPSLRPALILLYELITTKQKNVQKIDILFSFISNS